MARIDPDRARALADKFGAERAGDLDGLLGSGVDGLVIATPTSTHAGLIRAAPPQIVFHLAAQPLVRASYREPRATFATNVMGTVHVLEALRGLDARAVVDDAV